MTRVNSKFYLMGNVLLGILALVAVVVVASFLLTSCSKNETEKITKGTITANDAGEVSFKYSRIGKNQANLPDLCVFTTNLPAPNAKFTLYVSPEHATDTKTIDGLQAGQTILWETNVKGHPINIGSDIGQDHFVHIVND